MKIPMAVKLFPLAPVSWRTNQADAEDKVVFTVEPDKDVKKFLTVMGTKVVVKKSGESDRTKELLACGAPVGFRIGRILPKLYPDPPVEHAIIKGDCSQQRWSCGAFSIRQVACTEDLLTELASGKPSLCVMEHDGIMIRAAMEKYHDFLESTSSGKRPDFDKKVSVCTLDLLPELIKLSPETQYVITCHQRGFGISKEDKARYEQFDAVIKVMGWIDTDANTKLLLSLLRKHYAHAFK